MTKGDKGNAVGEAIEAVATDIPDEPAPATGTEPSAEEAPIEEPVHPYEAQIIDPAEETEPEAAAEAEDAQPEVPEGFVLLRYVGVADTFEHDAYTFRGGKPVAVPSEIAEELLTYPFERFERS